MNRWLLAAALIAGCGGSNDEEMPGDDDDSPANTTGGDTDTDPSTGGAGRALLFVVGDRVLGPEHALIPIGSAPRTVEAWLRTDISDTEHHAVAWGDATAPFAIGVREGRATVFTDAGDITGPVIADGHWAHVAVAYTGSEAQFFVNNQPAATETLALQTGSGPVLAGNGPTDAGWDGWVDELRIWDHARSNSEIAADAMRELSGDEAGLVLYWDMNVSAQGAGLTVPNGTATGSALDGVTEGTSTTPSGIDSDAF